MWLFHTVTLLTELSHAIRNWGAAVAPGRCSVEEPEGDDLLWEVSERETGITFDVRPP
jgi:hypothetical protein